MEERLDIRELHSDIYLCKEEVEVVRAALLSVAKTLDRDEEVHVGCASYLEEMGRILSNTSEIMQKWGLRIDDMRTVGAEGKSSEIGKIMQETGWRFDDKRI